MNSVGKPWGIEWFLAALFRHVKGVLPSALLRLGETSQIPNLCWISCRQKCTRYTAECLPQI